MRRALALGALLALGATFAPGCNRPLSPSPPRETSDDVVRQPDERGAENGSGNGPDAGSWSAADAPAVAVSLTFEQMRCRAARLSSKRLREDPSSMMALGVDADSVGKLQIAEEAVAVEACNTGDFSGPASAQLVQVWHDLLDLAELDELPALERLAQSYACAIDMPSVVGSDADFEQLLGRPSGCTLSPVRESFDEGAVGDVGEQPAGVTTTSQVSYNADASYTTTTLVLAPGNVASASQAITRDASGRILDVLTQTCTAQGALLCPSPTANLTSIHTDSGQARANLEAVKAEQSADMWGSALLVLAPVTAITSNLPECPWQVKMTLALGTVGVTTAAGYYKYKADKLRKDGKGDWQQPPFPRIPWDGGTAPPRSGEFPSCAIKVTPEEAMRGVRVTGGCRAYCQENVITWEHKWDLEGRYGDLSKADGWQVTALDKDAFGNDCYACCPLGSQAHQLGTVCTDSSVACSIVLPGAP